MASSLLRGPYAHILPPLENESNRIQKDPGERLSGNQKLLSNRQELLHPSSHCAQVGEKVPWARSRGFKRGEGYRFMTQITDSLVRATTTFHIQLRSGHQAGFQFDHISTAGPSDSEGPNRDVVEGMASVAECSIRNNYPPASLGRRLLSTNAYSRLRLGVLSRLNVIEITSTVPNKYPHTSNSFGWV